MIARLISIVARGALLIWLTFKFLSPDLHNCQPKVQVYIFQDVGVTLFFQIFLVFEKFYVRSVTSSKLKDLIFDNYEKEQRAFMRRIRVIIDSRIKKEQLRRRLFSVKDNKGRASPEEKNRLAYDF